MDEVNDDAFILIPFLTPKNSLNELEKHYTVGLSYNGHRYNEPIHKKRFFG